jgi:hypothetical protein
VADRAPVNVQSFGEKRQRVRDFLARPSHPAVFGADRFFATRRDYVEELLRLGRLREDGIFQPTAIELLVQTVKSERAVSTKDNMAVAGIFPRSYGSTTSSEMPRGV